MSQHGAIATHEEHHDVVGSKMGMWSFLVTEILMFFGIFLLYTIYRTQYPEDFAYSAGFLNTVLGTINTVVLLTSSLTVVLAIAMLERNKRQWSVFYLVVTIFLGLVFMVIKYFEWSAKIHHGLYPGSEVLLTHTKGENIFYGLYFFMTGLHGFHVLVGLVILGFMTYFIARKPRVNKDLYGLNLKQIAIIDNKGRQIITEKAEHPIVGVSVVFEESEEVNERNLSRLENAGLFWHLIDIIWIFLFPLLYLIS
ncbi:MAG: cytochrome c oxidase subunit 3 family protein [Calditrichia bacterium]